MPLQIALFIQRLLWLASCWTAWSSLASEATGQLDKHDHLGNDGEYNIDVKKWKPSFGLKMVKESISRKLNTSINHLLLWLCAASLLEATFGVLAKSLILGNSNVSPCHYVDRCSIVRVTCRTLWAFGCFTLFSENTKYFKRHIWHQSLFSDHHNPK